MKFFESFKKRLGSKDAPRSLKDALLEQSKQRRKVQEQYRLKMKHSATVWQYFNYPGDVVREEICELDDFGKRMSYRNFIDLAMSSKLMQRAQENEEYRKFGYNIDSLIVKAVSRGWQEFNEHEQKALHAFAATYKTFNVTVNAFLRKYGEDGLRIINLTYDFAYHPSVLADTETGKWMEIATWFAGEWFVTLFRTYAELLDAIDVIDKHLDMMGLDDMNGETRYEIIEKIRQRANNLLKWSLDIFNNDEKEGMELIDKITNKAENMITDIAVLADIVHVLKDNGDINTIKDISAVKVYTLDGKDALKNEKVMSPVKEIYKFNYKDKAHVLIERLEQLMADDTLKTSLRILTYGDDVLSFMIIKHIDEDTVELTALNAQKVASSMSVGTEMLRSVISQYVNAGKRVTAVASKAHAKHYIKAWGFVDVGTKIFEATGEEVVMLMHESSV